MSSIFSEPIINGLATFRKWLFRCAVGAIVLGVILGVVQIMTVNNLEGAEAFGKTFGTMICVGVMLIFLNICSKLIESRRAVSQIFAIIGGVSSLVWVVFAIISVWLPNTAALECTDLFSSDCNLISPINKISGVFGYLTLFGVICGALMNMYEGKRKDVILPLKITAAVLAGYEFLYFTIVTIIGRATEPRLAALAGFAAVVWFIVWIIALVLSNGEKKKDFVKVAANSKTEKKSDEELRAEIEEQVRREMIEKEVRARLEKEKKK